MGAVEIEPGFTFDEELHRYASGGVAVPSITQTLTLTGFLDPRWFNEESRDRGTATHRACWYLAEGRLDWGTVHPIILPRVKQFEAFLLEYKPTLIHVEKPLFSKTYHFAGTMDFLFHLMGFPSLVEVKTGKSRLPAALQTAAQKVLVEECLGIKDVKRFGFELSGEGRYKFVPHTAHGNRAMFLNAVGFVHERVNAGELKL